VRRSSRKRRWDPQPTDPAGVLLASDGTKGFSARAVARAAALADSRPVAVVTIARVYGTSLGLQHPGLLPSKAEMKERLGWIRDAISRLERKGVEADGQVASTRRPARTIVRVARARGVQTVVMEGSTPPRWRRFVEGDLGADVARRLGRAGITLEVVAAADVSGPAKKA
jgi:hypothetical protein